MYKTEKMRMVDGKNIGYGSLIIKDGLIEEVIWEKEPENPGSKVLMPAFCDLHVHFRDPGMTYKEDLETGMKAALAGGYTDVQTMANTDPVISNMELALDMVERGKALDLIDIHPCISITNEFDGKDISNMENAKEPVKMFSEDGFGVENSKIAYDSMKIAKAKNMPISLHEEDPAFSSTDMRIAEDLMTLRDIHLGKLTGAHLHFGHVSTKVSIDAIREAKKSGANFTAEATPHHLILWDNDYRVNPPIRAKEDVMALREALLDGTIDAIATDHAPHSPEDKEKGAPGMIGLEIAFGLLNTYLVEKDIIDLSLLSSLMSERPTKILNLNKGLLEPGKEADFIIIDLEEKWTIDPDKFYSKGKNTPFVDEELKGKVKEVYKKGIKKYPF